MKAVNNFKIGPDFELHTFKKKDLDEDLKHGMKGLTVDSDGEAFQCKKSKGLREQGQSLRAMNYMNMGLYLATPLLAGVLLGSYIDSKLNMRPVATILFIALGSVAMFYNLFRFTKKN